MERERERLPSSPTGSDLGLQHSGSRPRMKGLAGGERSREDYAFVNTGEG